MTAKEAIKQIKVLYEGIQSWLRIPNINNSAKDGFARDCESLHMAIEALEKQVLKKPEAYYDGYADWYPVWEFQCPCCERDVEDGEHHCICGQAIDWSDEE